MRFNSLAFRLFASAAAWTLVVLPVTAILLVSIYRGALERNFDARLNVYMTSLVASSTTGGSRQPQEPAPLGEPIFTVEREIRPAGPNSTPYSYAVAGDGDEIDRDLSEFTRLLIAALGVLGLGLLVATYFQVRYGLSPLGNIRKDLAAIRSGKAEKLEGELPYEIRPLQQELNALIQSNREIVDRARTHVGNLAHALKTPLSVISNEARSHQGPLATKVVEQAEVMRMQITHHLDRARVAARSSVIGDVTDVDQVLQGLKRALDRIHEERGLDLEITASSGLKFQGEKQDFEEMVGNLLDNACKWAKSRVSASTTCENGARRFTVTVDDDGPGLTEAERKRVVKRGQRMDESKPGSGLGLSIVADLAHLYKGRFELEPSPDGGLRARLELPAA
jgi:signal transduction histidine kinase